MNKKKLITITLTTVMAASLMAGAAFAGEEGLAGETEINAETAENTLAEDASNSNAENTTVLEESDNYTHAEMPELSEDGEVELGDYSTIRISFDIVEVTDSEIDRVIGNIIDYETTSYETDEGAVEAGDMINIDFIGMVDGTDISFTEGMVEDYDVYIGADSLFDGFDEQVIGHESGETIDVAITVPDWYDEEYAGQAGTLTVTINYKTVYNIPEVNDEFVQEVSEEYFGTQINTVEELRQYIYDSNYNDYLEYGIGQAILELINVKSYNESEWNIIYGYVKESYESQVEDFYIAMGIAESADEVAQIYGYETFEDWVIAGTEDVMKQIAAYDKIAQELGITVTDEEIDTYVEDQLKAYEIEEEYTVDEYKEEMGESWVLLVEKSIIMDKTIEVLKDRVEIVEESEILV